MLIILYILLRVAATIKCPEISPEAVPGIWFPLNLRAVSGVYLKDEQVHDCHFPVLDISSAILFISQGKTVVSDYAN